MTHRATAASHGVDSAESAHDPFGRNPRFVRRALKVSNLVMRYFSPEVHGVENLPQTGPVLLIGNHSGVMYLPDFWIALDAVTRRRGPAMPVHMMVHDLLMMTPGVRSLLRQLGAIPASPGNAEKALSMGNLVFAYPGGDWEACRPWGQRNLIDFHDHKGFVRLALRSGVPVVPVVSHGAQQILFVLSRGDRLARWLHIGDTPLRVNVLPFFLAPPFGVTMAPSPYPPPMPSAVTVKFLPALDWSAYGPEAADDPAVVDACYVQTVETMQATLDELSAEKPHPVLSGTSHLVRSIGHEAAHVLRQVV